VAGWVTLTEYHGNFRGAGLCEFDCAQPLVQQRMLVDGEPTHSRPFTARTNLIHVVCIDAPCLLEIDNPSVSMDLAAGGQEFFAVLPGSVLTVALDALAPVT
jgi:hypothetical protein